MDPGSFSCHWLVCHHPNCFLPFACFINLFHLFIFETGSPFVAPAGPELTTFLPQLPECWDYRRESPRLAQWSVILLPSEPVFPPLEYFKARALVWIN
jgi:hypothetical protein